ncbi:MAG: hydratase [Firmicutes bacterium]|nr:hydratase [Bacillota bacterium]
MIKLYDEGITVKNGEIIGGYNPGAKSGTMAYKILSAHNESGNMDALKLRFDAMASHDITYVGIIQTARASGLEKFPVPYVLTNCHNSLCAVGGTINEDDHVFGLSAARKYGGIFVPAHMAVIHSYMREMMAAPGSMILGSDSHTRYGALGTLAIGEGGPELAKQLLKKTYDVDMPPVIAVYLTGAPIHGVGPQDVALAIIGKVFDNGYVKNSVMEFIGDGIANLSMDFRNGIDVMTTETACLSSIWKTDEKTREWYALHGRADVYKDIAPDELAAYDGCVYVDLSKVRPMIAMPFHPAHVYTLDEVIKNPLEIIKEVERRAEGQLESDTVKFSLQNKVINGELWADQGVIAGCAGGTYENICSAANILRKGSVGAGEFGLSVYPGSQPIMDRLLAQGAGLDLIRSGAILRSAFCGPCFGAGDVPANGGFSIRHSTRNFPNREGSKITEGQIASVALMDARSIAATALNGGKLTSAANMDYDESIPEYAFNRDIYEKRCYFGFNAPKENEELKFGPNITDWPEMIRLTDDILLKVVSVIKDPVTTTDELIPSGETSSYRSNPLGLAEFTLSRKDPAYVPAAKEVRALEQARQNGDVSATKELFESINKVFPNADAKSTGIGSTIYAVKPGDGSAREQAASCQRVLGALANISSEYATKRYRSNLINWGMLPLRIEGIPFDKEDWLFVPGIREAVSVGAGEIDAYIVNKDMTKLTLKLDKLTDDEKRIVLAGSLINFYGE